MKPPAFLPPHQRLWAWIWIIRSVAALDDRLDVNRNGYTLGQELRDMTDRYTRPIHVAGIDTQAWWLGDPTRPAYRTFVLAAAPKGKLP